MTNLVDIYKKARKLALACVNKKKEEDKDPYLPVLDHYLQSMHLVRRKNVGLKEILTNRIVGTCHEGRTESFAANFMPLLEEDSEFATKWMSLYHYALEEGLRDPIQVYELFGHYFVEEGNKRVSVMKFLNNPLISASVIEIAVDPYDLPESELYEQFLKFEEATGVSSILMSQPKNYKKLTKIILGHQEKLSEEDRKSVLSLFYSFETVLNKLITQPIKATSGDAFLLFLEAFGYDPNEAIPDSTIEAELNSILPSVISYPEAHKAALLTETELSGRRSVLSFLKEPIKAALIETGTPQSSSWSQVHYQAFQNMARQMEGRVEIEIFSDKNTSEEIEQAFQDAIDHGAEVIFSAHPLMLQITNQFAVKYPKIRFLNCSLNPDDSLIRTYYTRGYEIQFLQGMAAGALTTSGKIGYIADYPIYGAISDINAFAIGVDMVRPGAKVYLEWSTTDTPTNEDYPLDVDMLYISGQDFDPRILAGKKFGLFDVRTGSFTNLSSTDQKWDVFYSRIMSSILNKTYNADSHAANGCPINYWLGLSNGLIDVTFSKDLPFQTRRLINQIKNDIADKRFFVFDGIHVKHQDEERIVPISLEEVAKMDWLVKNVVGTVPQDSQIIPSAEKLIQIHGIEVDPNKKDEVIAIDKTKLSSK